jgi:secreted PhoX family phosphatase
MSLHPSATPSQGGTPSDSRRQFLRDGLVASGMLAVGTASAWAQQLPALPANPLNADGLQTIMAAANLGPLLPPDANGLRLPAGFTSRVLARSGQTVTGTNYRWHGAPDGGACFAMGDGGWVYVCNSELASGAGGVSALRFNSQGNISSAYRICSSSNRNCAGGVTPWGTWLTCEEVDRGRVIECDPMGVKPQVVRNALGWFDHEAVAFDTRTGFAFLTEDKSDGRLYRFRPTRSGDLSSGTLEVARRIGSAAPFTLEWLRVPSPNPSSSGTRTRRQVSGSSSFNGGEGIWFHNGVVYFTTKGDNRVWALETASNRLDIIYDDNTAANPILAGVDNVTVSKLGDVYVAEDGGDMQVCLIRPDRSVAPILKLEGHDNSELAGIAFSPDGTRLYFSSQRGSSGSSSAGVTYEVRGGFLSI